MGIESQGESFLLPRFRKLVSSKSQFVGKELIRSLAGHDGSLGKITDIELTTDSQSLIIGTEQGDQIVLPVVECLHATVDDEEGRFSVGSKVGTFSV